MAKPVIDDVLRAKIAAIPGDDGWWRVTGQCAFERMAVHLIARGFTEDEAVAFLGRAYAVVAGEFGN